MMASSGRLIGGMAGSLVRHGFGATAVAIALMLGFAAVAWGSTSGAAAQGGEAMVRVIHASPDAPAVDVFVDGGRAIEGLVFGTATDFVALPAGEYDVDVAPAGGRVGDAVISATLDLEAGVR